MNRISRLLPEIDDEYDAVVVGSGTAAVSPPPGWPGRAGGCVCSNGGGRSFRGSIPGSSPTCGPRSRSTPGTVTTETQPPSSTCVSTMMSPPSSAAGWAVRPSSTRMSHWRSTSASSPTTSGHEPCRERCSSPITSGPVPCSAQPVPDVPRHPQQTPGARGGSATGRRAGQPPSHQRQLPRPGESFRDLPAGVQRLWQLLQRVQHRGQEHHAHELPARRREPRGGDLHPGPGPERQARRCRLGGRHRLARPGPVVHGAGRGRGPGCGMPGINRDPPALTTGGLGSHALPALGHRFSTNGDVLSFGYDNQWKQTDSGPAPVYGVGAPDVPRTPAQRPGPCITGVIDERHRTSVADGRVIEEGVIPGAMASVIARPSSSPRRQPATRCSTGRATHNSGSPTPRHFRTHCGAHRRRWGTSPTGAPSAAHRPTWS